MKYQEQKGLNYNFRGRREKLKKIPNLKKNLNFKNNVTKFGTTMFSKVNLYLLMCFTLEKKKFLKHNNTKQTHNI